MYWVMRCSLELENKAYERIYLKLPRNSVFSILDAWYEGYTWEKGYGQTQINVFTVVEGTESNDAFNKAFQKIRQSNNILSFLYGVNLGFNLHGADFFQHVNSWSMPIHKKQNNNIKRIKTFNNALFLLQEIHEDKYKYLTRCFEYLARALEFLDQSLTEESLLNAFKPIELLANFHYEKVIKHKISEAIKETYSLFFKSAFGEEVNFSKQADHFKRYNELMKETIYDNTHRKIQLFLNSLKINIEEKRLKNIIQIRSRDIAHGNITYFSVSIEDAISVFILSKEVVSKFFLNNLYKNAYLDVDAQ